jgi:hypothetical protein
MYKTHADYAKAYIDLKSVFYGLTAEAKQYDTPQAFENALRSWVAKYTFMTPNARMSNKNVVKLASKQNYFSKNR